MHSFQTQIFSAKFKLPCSKYYVCNSSRIVRQTLAKILRGQKLHQSFFLHTQGFFFSFWKNTEDTFCFFLLFRQEVTFDFFLFSNIIFSLFKVFSKASSWEILAIVNAYLYLTLVSVSLFFRRLEAWNLRRLKYFCLSTYVLHCEKLCFLPQNFGILLKNILNYFLRRTNR